MIQHTQELAWYLTEPGLSSLEVPADCHVVYFSDRNPVAFGQALRTLVSESVIIGISLDYMDGEDPRHSGEAPPDNEFEDSLLARLATFSAIANRWGHRLKTVGCHGTLALDVADDERCTQVLAKTIQRFSPDITLAITAGHRGIAVAHHCGIKVLREALVENSNNHSSLVVRYNNSIVDRYRYTVSV